MPLEVKKNMRKKNYDIFPEKPYDPEMLPSESGTTDPEPTKGVVVNTLLVNVRSKPDSQSVAITQLHHGDEFEILEMGTDYVRIKTHTGSVGYLAYEFCKEV